MLVLDTELTVSCYVTHPLVYNQTADDINGKMVIVTEVSLWSLSSVRTKSNVIGIYVARRRRHGGIKRELRQPSLTD